MELALKAFEELRGAKAKGKNPGPKQKIRSPRTLSSVSLIPPKILDLETTSIDVKVETLNYLHEVAKEDRLDTQKHFKAQYPRLRLSLGTLEKWVREEQALRTAYGSTVAERDRLQKFLEKQGYTPTNIFNVDETWFFYDVSSKQLSGEQEVRSHLFFAFAVNADGTEKRCITTGKLDEQEYFEHSHATQPGKEYRSSTKGFMTAKFYGEWLQRWELELRRQNRRIVLVQDNHRSHVAPNGLLNIVTFNFKPNLTRYVQPLDQGIIRFFKIQYRRSYVNRAIELLKKGVPPMEIYGIDQVEAINLAWLAWESVDPKTIQNCWRKAGILPPPSDTHPPDSLTGEDPALWIGGRIESRLKVLESIGVLQNADRLKLEAFLNPKDDIFDAGSTNLVMADDENARQTDDDPTLPTQHTPTSPYAGPSRRFVTASSHTDHRNIPMLGHRRSTGDPSPSPLNPIQKKSRPHPYSRKRA